MRQWRVYHADFFFLTDRSVQENKLHLPSPWLHPLAPHPISPPKYEPHTWWDISILALMKRVSLAYRWFPRRLRTFTFFLLDPSQRYHQTSTYAISFHRWLFCLQLKNCFLSPCASQSRANAHKNISDMKQTTSIRAALLTWYTLWTGLFTPGFWLEGIT